MAKNVKHNVVLFDNDAEEFQEYLAGIRKGSGAKWDAIRLKANEPQTSKLQAVIRYLKYFVLPLHVYNRRDRFNVIVGWQAFYGINFAFYCRLFKSKKENVVIIQHCVYKPKKGIVGKVYEKYMRYALDNKYVDIIQTDAEGYAKIYEECFDIPKEKIKYIQFGVIDFSKWEIPEKQDGERDFVLCIGRSNRDWEYVIDALGNTDIPIVIVCDTADKSKETKNIKILTDIDNDKSLYYFKNCRCTLTAVKDGNLSSGETIFCQQLGFGKPAVIVKPCSLTNNYLIEGYNGVSVERNADELIKAIHRMYQDQEYYDRLSNNCRKDFEAKYTLFRHSEKIGKLVKDYLEK